MPLRLSLLAVHPLLSLGRLKYAFNKECWSLLTPSTDNLITPLKACDPTADSTVVKLSIFSILWEWLVWESVASVQQTVCPPWLKRQHKTCISQSQPTRSNSTQKQWRKVQRMLVLKSNDYLKSSVVYKIKKPAGRFWDWSLLFWNRAPRSVLVNRKKKN